MSTRIYKLPIQGKVLNDKPLTGDENSPLCPIPLEELPGYDNLAGGDRGIGCVSLDYDVDEEWCEVEIEASETFHNWLLNLIPQLRDIAEQKGWILDKTELMKTREARQLPIE